MKKIVFVTIALVLFSLPVLAAGDHTLQWQKGNSYYQQKQYDSAAHYFELIAAQKPQSPELYYNLGNTYYRLNKIPLAVLNFERALRLNPDLKEAKENLLLAQGRINNHIAYNPDIFFIKWWDTLTTPNKSTIWAVAALITFTCIMLISIGRRFSKAGRRLPAQLQGVLAFACLCMLVLAVFAANNSEQHNMAVIMENDAPLMNNNLKGKPLTLVPEATSVKILDKRDNWLEVRLPDGRTGWLQQNLLEKI